MDILKQYHDIISSSITEEGITIPHALFIGDDEKVDMMALAVPPTQAYRVFLEFIGDKKPASAIFALDRYTKEGQGTKYRDLMAGFFYQKLEVGTATLPFIIEYQYEPRIVEPIDWSNAFWNDVLGKELQSCAK